jgi:hypothetical protein
MKKVIGHEWKNWVTPGRFAFLLLDSNIIIIGGRLIGRI